MFGFIKKLFGGKPAEATAEAPYKVETPANTYESYKHKAVTPPVLTEVVEAPKVEAAPVAEAKPAPRKSPQAKSQQAKNQLRSQRLLSKVVLKRVVVSLNQSPQFKACW